MTTKICKQCGREEIGYGSIINEDGYCPNCAISHNEEKIKRLKQQLNEANGALKQIYDRTLNAEEWSKHNNRLFEIANSYLERWGLQ